MANFVVNSADDTEIADGTTTLREALALANANADTDTITFSLGLIGQTITLSGAELVLMNNVTINGDIDGDGIGDVTIDADGLSRVFDITGGTSTLNALTITGGHSNGFGGGISVRDGADLTINATTLTGNYGAFGGALYNDGTVNLTNSTVSGNTGIVGGGILNWDSADMTISNVTLSGNTASEKGGAIHNNVGNVTVINSTITGNSATDLGGAFSNTNPGIFNLTNTIVVGNTAASDPNNSGAYGDNGGNVIGGSAASVFAALDANGGGLLADNGGPVQTVKLLLDALNPALDIAVGFGVPQTDATGADRIDIAGVGNNGFGFGDAGAFELNPNGLEVTTTLDVVDDLDGLISLREAVSYANSTAGADTITFASGLTGGVISLSGANLGLIDDVTINGDINGDGKADITISGGGQSRVFDVLAGTSTLNALNITDGAIAGNGGAVRVRISADLTISNTTLSGSSATTGGAVSNEGALYVVNSMFSGNSSQLGGGLINASGSTAEIVNTTFAGNTASSVGGAIYETGSLLSLTHVTASGNTALGSGGLHTTGTTTLTNSIFVGNSATTDDNVGGSGGTIYSGGNVIGGAAANIFAFVNGNGGGFVANNGGPVDTIALLANANNLAVDRAVDAGAPLTDATGAARVDSAGIGNDGANFGDAGALELIQSGLYVTTAQDVVDAFDGVTSLREAIAFADRQTGFSFITFDPNLNGSTITLDGAALVLNSDMDIDGDVDDDLIADITIDANGLSRVFNVADGNVGLTSLVITGGDTGGTGGGGGVNVESGAGLSLINSTLSGNAAVLGGAVSVSSGGEFTALNSTFSGNVATASGGGVFLYNDTDAVLVNTTFSGNIASDRGGAIFQTSAPGDTGALAMINTTITGNTATGEGGGVALYGNTAISNSIISANAGSGNVDVLGTFIDEGGNVTGEAAADLFATLDGNGNGLLADNGGPVQTIALKADAANAALDVGFNFPMPDATGVEPEDLPGVANDGTDFTDAGALELIESSLVVTTALDVVDALDGLVSLREAVTFAGRQNGADTITFASGMAGSTITLGGDQLYLDSDITINGDIDGDRRADITIDGGGQSRVFEIEFAQVNLNSLNITGGDTGGYGDGGGVRIGRYGDATIIDSAIAGNTAIGVGGGIANFGRLDLQGSTLSGNSAQTGGGIYEDGFAKVRNSTISGNTAVGDGGGIAANLQMFVYHSTISGNDAGGIGGGIADKAVGNTSIYNSIVLGNTATNNTDVAAGANFYYGGGNVTLGSAANVFAGLDANGGGTLGDNGGPGMTIMLRADATNTALDRAIADPLTLTDVTGAARVDLVGVGNDGTNFADSGAIELFTGGLEVTTSSDVVDALDGEVSLREAIIFANNKSGADTITFAAGISGDTITLGGGVLVLSSDIAIDGDINGDGTADITIDGGGQTRIFNVTADSASLHALNLTNGDTGTANSGGAVRIEAGADLTISNSLLSGNTANRAGGALYSAGDVTLTNSTLAGNTADLGGAIALFGNVTATMTNTTISGNLASTSGGAIYNINSSAILINSTVSGNIGLQYAGGISTDTSNGAITSLTNTIVLGNSAPTGVEGVGGFVDNGGNIYTGNSSEVFAAVNGLGGGVLADNGGPVLTIALLSDSNNLALDNGVDTAAPATDARGEARVNQPGVNNNGTAISDSGAYELRFAAPTITTSSAITVDEGTRFVVNMFAQDDESTEGAGLTYAITGGSDRALFEIDPNSGLLQFRVAPDFEIPGDTGGDNGYRVMVSVTDAGGFTGTQTLDVTVADVLETGGGLIVNGDSGENTLFGGDGNDTISGRNGDDRMFGGLGDDSIIGGRGNDVAEGGIGSDTIKGDSGQDTLFGGNGSDRLVGNSGGDVVNGDSGSDDLFGGKGRDLLRGGNGQDMLSGGTDADTLFGGAGDDALYGGTQNDRLDGGAGKDTFTGGDGADDFVFDDGDTRNGSAKRDVIADFGRGNDEIDLRLTDADNSIGGDQAFAFSGTTAAANSVWYEVSGNDVVVLGDKNGDGVSDFKITLLDVASLTASDFLL